MSASVVSKNPRSLGENGSVFLEFAISLGVFTLFLIGSFDLIRVFHVKGQLQMATDRVARLSALGGVFPGMDRATTIQTEIETLSGRDSVTVNVCPATAPRPCTGINVGREKEWMYVSATTQVPLVFNAVSIDLRTESLVRNEPVFKDRTMLPPHVLQAMGIFIPLAF